MFYGGVTVPVMRRELDAPPDQPKRSQITQRVTRWLNLAGWAALGVVAADVFVSTTSWQIGRRALWLAAVSMQTGIVVLHRHLSDLMAQPGFYDSDMATFAHWHSLYLSLSTVQWLTMLAFLGLSIAAWQRQDSQQPDSQPRPTTSLHHRAGGE